MAAKTEPIDKVGWLLSFELVVNHDCLGTALFYGHDAFLIQVFLYFILLYSFRHRASGGSPYLHCSSAAG